ncbi:hypothetical protein TNCV_3091931 [Trichonephila clavipes]|nr:hypothetical protein TNCV_3091931 [Trichonephila clavipes]
MIQQAYGRESLSQAQVFRWHKMFKEGQESMEDEPVHIKNCRKRTTWVTFFGHGPAFQCSYDHRTASNGKIGCAQSHHLGSCDEKDLRQTRDKSFNCHSKAKS